VISDKYLPIEEARLQYKVKQHLQKQSLVVLIPGGSSNSCQEPITYVIAILSDQKPYLLKVLNHHTNKHFAENIAFSLKTIITKLQKDNITTNRILSDNENKMKNVRSSLLEDNIGLVAAPGKFQFIFSDYIRRLYLCTSFGSSRSCCSSCYVEVFEAAGLIATKFKNTRLKQFLKKYSRINSNQRIGIIFLPFFSYCQDVPLAGATWWGSHIKTCIKLQEHQATISAVLNATEAGVYIDRAFGSWDFD
jgi:hypothetical protein